MINERIKLILNELNFKPADLAHKLNKSQGNLAAILKGNTKPSADFLIVLQNRLKININWLLTGEGEMFLNQTEHDYNKELSGNSEKLKMTPEQLDLILKAAGKEPEFMSYAAKAVSGDETAKERLKKLL